MTLPDTAPDPAGADRTFQVDLRGLVDLLSHHLYSSPRVYLRELMQNAVDARLEARRWSTESTVDLQGSGPPRRTGFQRRALFRGAQGARKLGGKPAGAHRAKPRASPLAVGGGPSLRRLGPFRPALNHVFQHAKAAKLARAARRLRARKFWPHRACSHLRTRSRPPR